ncbi:MAG TPA: hypothetical protein VFP97_05815 [Chitinophagaceae bacterium]|nr:hypothetical protein [Chitinophagaceae bacterium]
MSNYRKTEQCILIDQLSKFTADYTRLLAEDGDPLQLDDLRKEITAIQKEIYFREKLSKYTDASHDYITLNDNDII